MFFENLKSSTLSVASQVPNTILKTAPTNAPKTSTGGSFFDSISTQSLSSPQSLELLFRVLRIASAVFAILFIFLLLQGATQYIVSSGADDRVRHCRYLIFVGATGMIIMFCIYLVATSGLIRLASGS